MSSPSNDSSVNPTKSQENLTSESTPSPSTESEKTQTVETSVQTPSSTSRRSQRLMASAKPSQKQQVPISIDLTEETSKPTVSEIPAKAKGKAVLKPVKKEKVSPSAKKAEKRKRETTELLETEAEKKKFAEKFSQRPIVMGRTLDYKSLAEEDWDVQSYFRKQGWYGIPIIRDNVFPEVVRAFYSNLTVEKSIPSIQSKIKGKLITLHPEGLAQILNVPCAGRRLYNETNWIQLHKLKEKDVYSLLFKSGKYSRVASALTVPAKFMLSIVTQTLLPRAGSHEQVYPQDQIMIYHLMSGEPLNLPYMMIRHIMASAEKRINASLPYGMILTRIFEHFKFPFENEEILDQNAPILNEKVLRKMTLPGYLPIPKWEQEELRKIAAEAEAQEAAEPQQEEKNSEKKKKAMKDVAKKISFSDEDDGAKKKKQKVLPPVVIQEEESEEEDVQPLQFKRKRKAVSAPLPVKRGKRIKTVAKKLKISAPLSDREENKETAEKIPQSEPEAQATAEESAPSFIPLAEVHPELPSEKEKNEEVPATEEPTEEPAEKTSEEIETEAVMVEASEEQVVAEEQPERDDDDDLVQDQSTEVGLIHGEEAPIAAPYISASPPTYIITPLAESMARTFQSLYGSDQAIHSLSTEVIREIQSVSEQVEQEVKEQEERDAPEAEHASDEEEEKETTEDLSLSVGKVTKFLQVSQEKEMPLKVQIISEESESESEEVSSPHTQRETEEPSEQVSGEEKKQEKDEEKEKEKEKEKEEEKEKTQTVHTQVQSDFGDQFLNLQSTSAVPDSTTLLLRELQGGFMEPGSVSKPQTTPIFAPVRPQTHTGQTSSSSLPIPEEVLHMPLSLTSLKEQLKDLSKKTLKNQRQLLKNQDALFKGMDLLLDIMHQQQARQQSFETYMMHRLSTPSEPQPMDPFPTHVPRPSPPSSENSSPSK